MSQPNSHNHIPGQRKIRRMVNSMLLAQNEDSDDQAEEVDFVVRNRFRGLLIDQDEVSEDEDDSDELISNQSSSPIAVNRSRKSQVGGADETAKNDDVVVDVMAVTCDEPQLAPKRSVRVEMKFLDPNFKPSARKDKSHRQPRPHQPLVSHQPRADPSFLAELSLSRISMTFDEAKNSFSFGFPTKLIDAEIEARRNVTLGAISSRPGESCRGSTQTINDFQSASISTLIAIAIRSCMSSLDSAQSIIEKVIWVFYDKKHFSFMLSGPIEPNTKMLPYSVAENRPFHICLFIQAHFLHFQRKSRTALEISKLLLRLDSSDALCVRGFFDQFALCSDPNALIDLFDGTDEARTFPNLAFGIAIAKFSLLKRDCKEVDDLLIAAIGRFPEIFKMILDRLSVCLDRQSETKLADVIDRSSYVMTDTQKAIGLLFVGKTRWSALKIPEIVSWFERILTGFERSSIEEDSLPSFPSNDRSIDRFLILSTSLPDPHSRQSDFNLIDEAKAIIDSRIRELCMRVFADPCNGDGSIIWRNYSDRNWDNLTGEPLNRLRNIAYTFFRSLDPRYIAR